MITWIIDNAEFVSAIIALIALIRPEITSFAQRRKAQLDFHIQPSKKILINFRGQPQCWLDGTLESVWGNNLISDISLNITRQQDNATYKFQWVYWESRMIGDQRASPAYAFPLFQNTTISGLFSFRDDNTLLRYSDDIQKLKEEFNLYLKRTYPAPTPFPDDLQPDFQNFSNTSGSSIVQNTFFKVQRAIYWEMGRYTCVFTIFTKRPQKKYSFEFNFELTSQDQVLLEQNAIRALWVAIGIKDVPFNQAESIVENFKQI